MDRLITSNKIESVIKKLPTSEIPGPDDFSGELNQNFKEELKPILFKLSKKVKRKKYFWTHSVKQPISWYQNQTKTPHKNYPNQLSLMNIDVKILNKILANWIQQYINRIIHHDQVGFFPGMSEWFGVCKSINTIHHVNKVKNINYMIIWIENAFDKIQHPFMIQTFNKSGYRRNISQHNKDHIWPRYS